jgi:hypothetical protein
MNFKKSKYHEVETISVKRFIQNKFNTVSFQKLLTDKSLWKSKVIYPLQSQAGADNYTIFQLIRLVG